MMQGAKIAGASKIIAVDRLAPKLDLARTLGATDVVDASVGDPVEAVKALTGGRGADYTFEVVGISATIKQSFAMTRRGGTTVLVGAGSPSDEVTLQRDGPVPGHEDSRRVVSTGRPIRTATSRRSSR